MTFNINDLRLQMAIQRAMELDMRGGTQYIEWLQANFNSSPKDARLQKPEYIGRKKFNMQISEVLQTSQTTSESPQGNMSGHSVGGLEKSKNMSYYAEEHGIILGITCIYPVAQYQQGLDKNFCKKTKEEFYRPQYAFVGEQAILNKELDYCGVVS